METTTTGFSRPPPLEQAIRCHRCGEFDVAERLYRKLIEEDPRNARVLDLLSTVARQQGRHDQALEFSRTACSIDPTSALYLFNLGECCRANGLYVGAVDAYQKAIALRDDLPAAHVGLAQAYVALRRDEQASKEFERGAQLDTGRLRSYEQWAACLMRLGRVSEAEAVCRRAIEHDASIASYHYRLALVLVAMRRWREADLSFRRAIELKPNWLQPRLELAKMFNFIRVADRAEEAARQALAIDPRSSRAQVELGVALRRQVYVTPAAAAFSRALQLEPGHVEALTRLAGIELGLLAHDQALTHLRRAAELAPTNGGVHCKLLEALNYPHDTDERTIFEEHRRWGAMLRDAASDWDLPPTPSPNPHTPLRIGYVSADLRNHPVPSFLEPILIAHDRDEFEPVVFCDVERPDEITARLRGRVREWHDTSRLPDRDFARFVRERNIDILVDLCGHTSRSRLLAFAAKLAPVQVSYLGYANTTGLPGDVMQYRLTDEVCDPLGVSDSLHTEKLVRLPGCFLCYQPAGDSPEVLPPPCACGGRAGTARRDWELAGRELAGSARPTNGITFGCFNNMVKITVETIERWSKILHRLPGSQLLLKNRMLGDIGTCGVVRDAFAKHGIDAGRLTLLGHEKRSRDHLAMYGRMDIALDTYPYHGTTTTCEALWMGVPVVTQAGRTHRSRVGASLLTAVGLEDLVADSEQRYVEIAVELAKGVDHLVTLRRELRERVRQSVLTDRQRFTSQLESAYRGMMHCD